MKPHLFIAIPALDELDYLPKTLDAVVRQQTNYAFSVYVCVNQPEEWWELGEKRKICERNRLLCDFLNNYPFPNKVIIDRSSSGKGWKGKNFGVGMARKVLFEKIMENADSDDIIISLDADTCIPKGYLQSIGDNFEAHPDFPVISVPYYHPLNGDEKSDRALLHYEIYLRNWHINLSLINSPYTFTALGSAIAMKVWALKKIGGITPLKSGEDFYMLQKFRKMTPLNLWNEEPVYPAGRVSDRVFFGTGPAIAKGVEGDRKSYPIFHHTLFHPIAETYHLIDDLFSNDIESSFLSFLQEQFKQTELWEPLRKNFKDLPHFVNAFHQKADGLRIFQFVRNEHEKKKGKFSDEKGLWDNLQLFSNDISIPDFLQPDFSFKNLNVNQLNIIRNLLYTIETRYRKASI